MAEGFQAPFLANLLPIATYGLSFGLDGLSILLIVLTNFFILLGVFALGDQTPKVSEALSHLLILQFSVLVSFAVLDLIGFFAFFEITLIPIYFLILG